TNVTNNIGHIFWISVGKLIVYPSISIVLAIMLGFTGVEIATIIAVFATPCGVSGYTMAAATDNDGELAGQLVVITSVAAIFTMTAIFSICQVGGWI
ncbi:MAG: AEC family transporter, partial [Anaerovoracaceae bacterium]